MKKFFYKSSVLALTAGILLTSCDPEIDAPDPSSGEADFTSYLAVGNSLSAGFADGGLYRESQLSSLPAILADQFEEVGGGEFVQPLFSEAQANGSGYLKLVGFTPQGTPITETVTTNLAIRGLTSKNTPLYTKFTNNINNLAIPGIRVADIKTAGYGSTQGNPYFERLTDNPGLTYLQYVQAQAQAANHTFFSLWIAENDVLAYATSGGAFSGGMLNSDAQRITPVNTFTANYTELVDALTAGGKEGVLATVPDVTAVPFFTTVGGSVKQLLAANKIPAVVALTESGNSRIVITPSQINVEGGVYFPLTASAYAPLLGTPTGRYWRLLARQVSSSPDPVTVNATLTAILANYQIDTTQMFGLSQGNPLPSALVLDAAEQVNIKNATTAFNDIIKAQATAKGLALWDAYGYFNSIKNGFVRNSVTYSPSYITGNLFSLDGIHLTPRGSAIAANEIIKAINSKYNSTVPQVDETQYRAVLLP
ncbi:hypothetical protein ABID22_001123 [Pontibacter aydingkolensis]|uniref:SGNH/GDSL hydrolase family protein n=1 Tax=Pontibacter aydingkolensis TaxID=1911536 RepID=A0ABS7CT62_9BACT|nr:SGNH/GDSL hydrolase family protein [Pontibacter aydingkolensis]MBW7467032.1 SGNH/GDSL hydrolase family protein [Pontibacter aydingkolensis]